MIDNFRGKLKKRPKQENKEGKIDKKGKGRPRKPNKQSLHITIDKQVKTRFEKWTIDHSPDMSAKIEELLRNFLREEGY